MRKLLRKIRHVFLRVATFKNWYELVFPFNKLNNSDGRILKLRGGFSIYVRTIYGNDFHTVLAVAGRDDYGLGKMALPAMPIILDVGGHVGSFTICAKRYFPKAHIFTFEPEPQNRKLLQENIARNFLSNVTVVPKGVSEEEKEMTLYVHPSRTGSHSTVAGTEGEPLRVEMTTLASVVNEYHVSDIDLLKLDIEGAEYDVLFSCPDDVLLRVRRIVMEVHDNTSYTPEELTRFLEKKGFNVKSAPTSPRVYWCERKG